MNSINLRTLGFCAVGLFAASNAFASDRVIYGEDNRQEIFESTNELHVKLADSTAMLIRTSQLKAGSSDDKFSLPGSTFGQARNLCADEPYRDQVSPGFCSGFLVGKNTFVTAGHCITSDSSCSTTSFVFNYYANQDGTSPSEVLKSNVYSCKKIIKRFQQGSGADYAVIELDREVPDHAPLAFRNSGKIEDGTELVMIGHPAGLPSKIDDGGVVRDNSKAAYIIATTDSYGGNSGSAVFDRNTGVIEGILVRGENDYVSRGGCTVSNVCTETGCRGEDITRATEFSPYVPAETPAPAPQ